MAAFSAGSGSVSGPIIWAYDRRLDRFKRIFMAVEQDDHGSEVRFITDGPLAGYVIIDEMILDGLKLWAQPSRYEITVYRLQPSERYVKILDYERKTADMDNNHLAVIDAEMPEIERKLGNWKPGEPLFSILDATVSAGCETPIRLNKGLAWCE
jgi:hypothetical protein